MTHLPLRDSRTFDIDVAGFFEGEPLWKGDVYPGSGVKFIAWDEAHRHVYGRADAEATKAAVWQMLPGTGFVPETIAFAKGSGSHRERALAALSRQIDARCPVFAAAIGRRVAENPDPGHWMPSRSADIDGPHETVAGLDLSAWVPAHGGVFARFRSAEAAYRVLGELDAFAGAALAVADEDARDHGTLRLVLHDLLLPTIWRTNPESERGVGEVAVFVERPLVRGRMEVAAILRVTDPELHRMQTEAGIADDARPEHLWQPAHDPFPEGRARRNFRCRVADVEIVATDAELLARIAERRFHPLAEDPEFATARWGAPGAQHAAPSPDEAALLFDPDADGSDPTVMSVDPRSQEAAGLEWLLQEWLGDAGGRVFPSEVRASRFGIRNVRWCRVMTDSKGMAVAVRFRSDAHARAAWDLVGERFADADTASARARNACLRNVADLVPLALVENPQDDVAERNFVVLGWKPVCPCGGTYSVHPITREVSCSVHGTVKSPKTATWTPPPISDVTVDGTELSFRLAIDWNRQR